MLLLFAGLLLLLPAGCAPPPEPESRVAAAAQRHNRQGIAAVEHDDMPRALREFRRAYELFASIEDFQGCVTLLINQSRVNRRLGDLTAATATIDRAVEIADAVLPEEVAFEKALVLLAVQDLSEAQRWAQKALLLAEEQNRGPGLNLLGRIELAAGNLSASGDYAELALKSLSADSGIERANSLRLLGQIALRQGRAEQALAYFGQALLVDKDSGLGPRILSDLTGLAEAESLRENYPESLAYLRRALTVSRYNADEKETATILKQLEDLCSQKKELQCDGRVDSL
jgi:tetratricopeptide (TPR) repeat protein